MYAMLTGFLPYTVDPFNITALHAKMLENKMNPIPTTLTPGRPYTFQTVLLVMCLTHSLCVCVCRLYRPLAWVTDLRTFPEDQNVSHHGSPLDGS